jgi:hypothetical protein
VRDHRGRRSVGWIGVSLLRLSAGQVDRIGIQSQAYLASALLGERREPVCKRGFAQAT